MSDITITKVDMYGIPSRNTGRSLAFYTETLGLKPDPREKSEVWAGDLCLSIWEPEQMGMEFVPNNNGPAFHVDDIDSARKTLEEKGVEFKGDTLDTGVCHMAMFNDPDGNELIIHHRYKAAA